MSTPWKQILLSFPFWTVASAQVGNFWGYYTLMTGTPLYLNGIQHFSVEQVISVILNLLNKTNLKTSLFTFQNGLISALPQICGLVVTAPFGWLSDKLIASGKISRLNCRKIFNAIGNYGPACGLIWLAFVGCDRVMAVVVLCLATTLDAASFSGFMVKKTRTMFIAIRTNVNLLLSSQLSHYDLSPNFSGTTYGMANTLSNICGFVTPTITGVLTNDNVSF